MYPSSRRVVPARWLLPVRWGLMSIQPEASRDAGPVPAGTPGPPAPDGAPERRTRRHQVHDQFTNLVEGIARGDDSTVEEAVLALSRKSRWLAPLALLVGGFAMLFQGVKTLFTNWRLTLVQILPAMWIWVAMIDLKAHVLHGKGFHQWKHLWVEVLVILVIAAITAASFYLNAVFAFAISTKGTPEIRPAFVTARSH